MNEYKYRVTDNLDCIIWTGSGKTEATAAYRKACSEFKRNYIKLQEFKKDRYITLKGAVT